MPDTHEDTALLCKRFEELAQRAYNSGRYSYSDFLNTAEQAALCRMKKRLDYVAFSLWGGAEDCERRIAAFGNEALCGGAPEWPLTCLLLAPRGVKFAEALSHRDYLGALMNLGIERGVLGDIILRSEGAYLFCTKRIAAFIQENLLQVKHTAIACTVAEALPEGALFSKRAETAQVNSPRVDALIARAYKQSREASLELFRTKRVFINGALCENNSRILNEGDVVSVRGSGRFVFAGVTGTSKKGKLNVRIEKYEAPV